ncbi:MAG: hypothetical protein AMXMBFR34_45620 [Myxococcaceae bacterium]
MRLRFFLSGLVVFTAALLGCASATPTTRAPEALYLAVEVQHDGQTVASPKVLGYEGHRVVVERRSPSAANPDYRLTLTPHEEGQGYKVLLDLDLPSGHRFGRVGLLHGEEQKVALDSNTELKVMLMRVDSPEFRALIQRTPAKVKGNI